MKPNFKLFLVNLFEGLPFPVFSKQLRGMWLRISPLMSGRLYFNNVEPQVHNVYNIFLKDGCTFFDIGSNVGLHSYYVNRKYKGAVVHAFEPLPANAAYIKSAIKLNNINGITLHEEAVADKNGTAYFDQSINNHQGHISTTRSSLEVKVTSLDTFINVTGIIPDFIKIDVEGSESQVMEGFREHINRVHPVMIIEVHNKEQSDKILAYFNKLDYKLVRIIPAVSSTEKYFMSIDIANTDENITGQVVAVPASMYSNYGKYIYDSQ